MSNTPYQVTVDSSLKQALSLAKGPIEYNMTNDYMFRAVLQSNEQVLRGLVCSLLHFNPEEIQTIEITNPINLGETIDTKDFVLDIDIILNNHTRINLEMQVLNYQNWPERSLSYLCRSFDSLNKGDDYIEAKPAIHVSILDFDPFPDFPEFYASYKMLNEKNHHVYSDKFSLHVLSLNHVELATEEDMLWEIDHWVRLFKAKTWEELKMIAKQKPDFIALSEEMYKQHADETIRAQCRAREDFEARERATKKHIANLTSEIETLSSEVEALSSENEALSSEIDLLKKIIEANNINIPASTK